MLQLDRDDVEGHALHGGFEHRTQHVVGDQALVAGVGAMTDAHDHHAVGADLVDADGEAGAELVQNRVERVSHGVISLVDEAVLGVPYGA